MVAGVPSPNEIAQGFKDFGGLVWGLSLALAALGLVSGTLLHVLLRFNRELQRQIASLTEQSNSTQEKRVADKEMSHQKLEALARETVGAVKEVENSLGTITALVQELLARRRKPPKE